MVHKILLRKTNNITNLEEYLQEIVDLANQHFLLNEPAQAIEIVEIYILKHVEALQAYSDNKTLETAVVKLAEYLEQHYPYPQSNKVYN